MTPALNQQSSKPKLRKHVKEKIAVKKEVVINADDDDLESDEEADLNRIGNVPLEWYKGEDHVGYDIAGHKIQQLFGVETSEIDRLLAAADNPDAWRTIIDFKNQTKTILSATDLEIIRRIREGKLGVQSLDDLDVEFATEEGKTPLVDRPPRKSPYLPNKDEEKRINHFIALIRTGRLYQPAPPEAEVFDLWGEHIARAADEKFNYRVNMAVPKLPFPGHAESYNPPDEYLPTKEEIQRWEEQHPDDRMIDFVPRKFACLRHVPAYEDLLLQRYQRCLDIYLCPRTLRKSNFASLEDILPELPPLHLFYPYPQQQGFILKEKGSSVSSVAVSRDQTLLLAGCDDGSVSLHNIGQRPYTLPLLYLKSSSRSSSYKISGLQFHPQLNICAFGRSGYLFICLLRDVKLDVEEVKEILSSHWRLSEIEPISTDMEARHRQFYESVKLMRFTAREIPTITDRNRPKSLQNNSNKNWRSFKSPYFFKGLGEVDEDDEIITDLEETGEVGHDELHNKDWEECNKFVAMMKQSKWIVSGFVLRLGAAVSNLDFHEKGLYLASTSTTASIKSNQILLHNLRKKLTLRTFADAIKNDRIRSAKFHSTQAWMCLGLDKSTRIYSLVPDKKQVGKQYGGRINEFHGTDVAGDIAVHGKGKHIFRATDDGKLVVYDTEIGKTPFKVIKLADNTTSLTTLQLHIKRPLLAVGTSEGNIHLVHVSLDEDSFLEDLQVVPLIRLKDANSAVTSMTWFGHKHWLATGHRDGRLIVWI